MCTHTCTVILVGAPREYRLT